MQPCVQVHIKTTALKTTCAHLHNTTTCVCLQTNLSLIKVNASHSKPGQVENFDNLCPCLAKLS